MVSGNADNLLIATYLSIKCEVFFAPAMDLDMYKSPANKKNIETLVKNGDILIKPGTGSLASGMSGEGRVEEPELILDILKNYIKKKLIFKDKSFLITAGPTFEMIDPVRFIGNFSSGKMGYELAKEASRLGAKVHLISGPSNEQINDENIILKRIVSADEMFDECSKVFNDIDVFIMSAAVSDYKPSKKNHNKIKKDQSEKISVQLIKNKDILKSLASKKTKGQKVIGFSLETQDELKNATKKLKNKNLDAIILNSLNDEGAGFNLPTNKISFITSSYLKDFTVKTKKDVAKDILLEVFNL